MSAYDHVNRGILTAMMMTVALTALVPAGGRASPQRTAARPAALYSPPPFRAAPSPPGVLRIWGPKAMSAVVGGWAEGFHRLHPGIRVRTRLMGSDTAIPGLYAGRADIALMGRRDDVTDDNGFSRPKGYRFRRLKIMNGSLDTQGKSPALAILVSAANPISHLTLEQLAAIAGCGCSRHAPAPIRLWGQLGAHGAWANRPVHLYMIDAANHTGRFFLRVVLDDSRALDWDRVSDFTDLRGPDGTVDSAAAQAAAAVRRDPGGIAVSTVGCSGRGLKVVSVAAHSGGPFVTPDRKTIIAGTYPLARSAYAFIDQPPGRSMRPEVGAFLSYVLSPRGQSVVLAGGYLPLSRHAAAGTK